MSKIGAHHTMNRSTFCKVCKTPDIKLLKIKTETGAKYMCQKCKDKIK